MASFGASCLSFGSFPDRSRDSDEFATVDAEIACMHGCCKASVALRRCAGVQASIWRMRSAKQDSVGPLLSYLVRWAMAPVCQASFGRMSTYLDTNLEIRSSSTRSLCLRYLCCCCTTYSHLLQAPESVWARCACRNEKMPVLPCRNRRE